MDYKNPDSGLNKEDAAGSGLWLAIASLLGTLFVAYYAVRHPEVLALREAAICQAQYLAQGWAGFHRLAAALAVHLRAFASVAALFVLAWLAGSRVIGLCRGSGGGFLLPLGLGLGGISLLVLAQGFTGLLNVPVLLGAAVALFLACGRGGKLRFPVFPSLRPRFLTGMLALLVLFDLLMCLYPEWYLDGLAWHLAMPERSLMIHKVVFLPNFVFSLFPMGGEMVYASMMAFGGEEAAKMANLGCGVAAALAAGRLAVLLGAGNTGGALASLVFISMPMSHLQNGVAFIDNIRTFLETLALGEVVRVWRGAPWRDSLGGGILMGMAFGVKQLAAPRAGLLALSLLFVPRLGRGRRISAAAVFALGALAAALPWMARGWLEGADPVYPLLTGWKGAFMFGRDEMGAWVTESVHQVPEERTLAAWLTLPWRFSLDLYVGHYGSYTAGPLAFLLAMVIAVSGGWRPASLLVLALCAVEWVEWSLTSNIGRYLMPMMAAFYALGGWAIDRRVRPARSVVVVIMLWACCALFLRGVHRCNLYQEYGLANYMLGRSGGADMAVARGFDPAIMAKLPPGRLLLAGDIPPLGAGRPWTGASGFNLPLIKTWARESTGYDRFRVKVKQEGVRGVALSGKELVWHTRRGPGYALTAREERMVHRWLDGLRRVGSNSRFEFLSVPD